MRPKADFVFEISWEVCNKVGGISTVITSKASRMEECYPDRYYAIGPYIEERAREELRPEPLPAAFRAPARELAKKGIALHCGRWNIKGFPRTILIDFRSYWSEINAVKARLWEWYNINSLGSPRDYDEPVLWAWAVGMFLEAYLRRARGVRAVVQFHEWLSGSGLLYLRHQGVRAGLVFTTHATVAGRALASRNIDIYRDRDTLDVSALSYQCSFSAKHELERAVAHAAHVFTTVSAMTGDEAASFLGRAPDMLLPNGLDIVQFPQIKKAISRHEREKGSFFDFLGYYFFPYYVFDASRTLFYFTASRYEFHDKGIDLFIEALSRLNERLKARKSEHTVVVFFWVPAGTGGVRGEVREWRERYFRLLTRLKDEGIGNPREHIPALLHDESARLLRNFGFETLRELREFKRRGTPPLTTHAMDESRDQIVQAFRAAGLLNRNEDRVKAVFYPTYLSSRDGLLNLGYLESMQGTHLGVFPSYYEPWGYTPLESAALGVPAVTTDLSGFGRYLQSLGAGERGVYVLRRGGDAPRAAVDDLQSFLWKFTHLDRRVRHRLGAEARRIAEFADWKYFVRHYVNAHNAALEAAFSV